MKREIKRDCAVINKWYLKFEIIKHEERDEQSDCHEESLSF